MNNKELHTLDYISLLNIVKSDFVIQQYQLYALSKLKYKNHNKFCRFLLLLSGDVEPNQGPEYSCTVCDRKLAVTYIVVGNVNLGYIKDAQIYQSLVINR